MKEMVTVREDHYKVGNLHYQADGKSVLVTKDTPEGIETVNLLTYKTEESAKDMAYAMAMRQRRA